MVESFLWQARDAILTNVVNMRDHQRWQFLQKLYALQRMGGDLVARIGDNDATATRLRNAADGLRNKVLAILAMPSLRVPGVVSEEVSSTSTPAAA